MHACMHVCVPGLQDENPRDACAGETCEDGPGVSGSQEREIHSNHFFRRKPPQILQEGPSGGSR